MECISEEEELCEYERKRLENIRRNCELLKSLGTLFRGWCFVIKIAAASSGLPLPGSVVNKPCTKRKQLRTDEGSEEDEQEWQPWMEEAKKVKRRRSERIGKGGISEPLYRIASSS